ncbi:unnamed protein product, partial [Gulo gulo]
PQPSGRAAARRSLGGAGGGQERLRVGASPLSCPKPACARLGSGARRPAPPGAGRCSPRPRRGPLARPSPTAFSFISFVVLHRLKFRGLG